MPTDASAAASLLHAPSDLIGGDWVPIAGETLVTHNPAHPGRVVYAGGPRLAHVGSAVACARAALPAWSRLGMDTRAGVLKRFAELCKSHAGRFADLICDEIGKALWESKGEASLLASKVDITLDPAREGGLHRVSDFELTLSPSRTGRTSFRPHGVMAVLGPFNFPCHLPNGHIVPALLMGNTVVFKPSDKAPACGQMLVEVFDLALREVLGGRYIPGVVNLVQGGADVAQALVHSEGVDAIAFTGSWAVGRKILQANLDRPGRICALELGGNNAAVVMGDADLKLAAVEIVRSAFATTGQRCTCTRRAIVHESIADRLIPLVGKITSTLVVGDPRAGHPVFMGPINNRPALDAVLGFQQRLRGSGAEILVESTAMAMPGGGHYATPGIARVRSFRADEPAAFDAGCDTEIFGPLLRLCVVRDLDEAIEQANATRYGLAASIFTGDPHAADRFVHEARAGCINVNTGTAGASSKLPFGGLGLSGNHRPAGSFALDYCAYPVASMLERQPSAGMTLSEGMRVDEAWIK